jgi:hypothetical protein
LLSPALVLVAICVAAGCRSDDGNLNLQDFAPDGIAPDDLAAVRVDGDPLERWRMISEQIRFFDMPPTSSKQPSAAERQQALAWIRTRLLRTQEPGAVADRKASLPEFGNHVDHDALFSAPARPVIPAAPRLWRVRPEIYRADMNRIAEGAPGIRRPFSTGSKPGIRDYAALHFVDEPATDLLLRNAELVVANQAKSRASGEIYQALQPGPVPDLDLMAKAIRLEFRMALRREPHAEEIARFTRLWQKNIATSGHPIGSRYALMAVLMQPEALFRLELGASEIDALGRRRLSQREIARAVSFALRDEVDAEIRAAADAGALVSRDQVAAHVKRLLADPQDENPRLLEFFREYFGYLAAIGVFKDPPPRGSHDARLLVDDLEYLILHVLEEDRDVLRTLLTTNKAFVNWRVEAGSGVPARPDLGIETVYGLPPDWKWTVRQPIALRAGERAGVLTHPAWLVAWSGNFDNDPVRRGKWIRTHLLGGSVPDVPIGVDARVPEAEHLTLRERLASATSKPECWRCHKKMDPLGLPFERFTHYGYFRRNELQKPVNAHGTIDRTGDPRLDGTEVTDAIEMIRKLAGSERVEQVFVRHAFRFFSGRNETLGDAATLQDAWKAYRRSEGSFHALVTSLLTSDSFLYRTP